MREFNVQLFSKRLKDLRSEKEISLFQLEQKIGINHASLNGWERGKNIPAVDKVFLLAQYFDVSIDFLTGLEDEFGNKIKK